MHCDTVCIDSKVRKMFVQQVQEKGQLFFSKEIVAAQLIKI